MRGEGDAGGGLIALVGGNLGCRSCGQTCVFEYRRKGRYGAFCRRRRRRRSSMKSPSTWKRRSPSAAFFDGCEAQGQTHLGTLILGAAARTFQGCACNHRRRITARRLPASSSARFFASKRPRGAWLAAATQAASFRLFRCREKRRSPACRALCRIEGRPDRVFARASLRNLRRPALQSNVIATALFDVQVAAMSDGSEAIKGIPVGRPGRSDEAARAALYLASHNAGYVTGETLNLSGGVSWTDDPVGSANSDGYQQVER